jgi:hypothetical protein
VQRAPGIPRALCFFWAEILSQLGRIARREREGVSGFLVIARSEATKQSILSLRGSGLLRFARNDGYAGARSGDTSAIQPIPWLDPFSGASPEPVVISWAKKPKWSLGGTRTGSPQPRSGVRRDDTKLRTSSRAASAPTICPCASASFPPNANWAFAAGACLKRRKSNWRSLTSLCITRPFAIPR